MDFISEAHDPKIGKFKDMAAATVLIGAFVAIAIACFVFGPKIF
jgi:diacylglycerol kinase